MEFEQAGVAHGAPRHEKSAVITRACTRCRHARAAHVDGTCQGWPSKDGTGPTIVNGDGQTLHTEPCRCDCWTGTVEDLGVIATW
jgi:hypothetical protein